MKEYEKNKIELEKIMDIGDLSKNRIKKLIRKQKFKKESKPKTAITNKIEISEKNQPKVK